MNMISNKNGDPGLPVRMMSIVGLACFFIAGIVLLWWYQSFGPGYYYELEMVQRQLQAIPEVEILELHGHDENDFPLLHSLENITARIKVANEVEMVFSGLSAESFQDGGSVILVGVGPYRIRYRGEGYVGVYKAATGTPVRSEFAGSSIRIGDKGDFAQLFPFKIPNIQTAVTRCHDILDIVGSWPETPSPPLYFKNSQGTEFCYWVAPEKTYEQQDALWMRPYSVLRTNVIHRESDRPHPEAPGER